MGSVFSRILLKSYLYWLAIKNRFVAAFLVKTGVVDFKDLINSILVHMFTQIKTKTYFCGESFAKIGLFSKQFIALIN